MTVNLPRECVSSCSLPLNSQEKQQESQDRGSVLVNDPVRIYSMETRRVEVGWVAFTGVPRGARSLHVPTAPQLVLVWPGPVTLF